MTELPAPIRIEPDPKWVRGYRRDRKLVDSRAVKLVWTHPRYPTWFFPLEDIADELVDEEAVAESPYAELPGHMSVRWDAIDHWFEEDVEVFVHPRDPYTRLDVLPSSRHVKVSIVGTVVAESRRPTILFETGHPPRYYLPPGDVRFDLLTPTAKRTGCPYKGQACYWTAVVDGIEHPDIAWAYPTPLPESDGIAGLVCFYDELADVEVDGVPQSWPRTAIS